MEAMENKPFALLLNKSQIDQRFKYLKCRHKSIRKKHERVIFIVPSKHIRKCRSHKRLIKHFLIVGNVI